MQKIHKYKWLTISKKVFFEKKTWVFFTNFLILVSLLTFFDQFTKTILSFWPKNWKSILEENNYKNVLLGNGKKINIFPLIGLKSFSIGNPTTTFLGFFNLRAPTFLVHINSFIVMFVSLVWTWLRPKISTFIACALIFAGSLGNTLDRMLFSGVVRDVFYFEWRSSGIWNLADMYILFSIFGIIIFNIFKTVVHIFNNEPKKKSINKLDKTIKPLS